MVALTLLELHVHDGVDFSPRGVIGGETAATDDESTDDDRIDLTASDDRMGDESAGDRTSESRERPALVRRSLRTAVGIAAVGAAAYAVRRRRASVADETDEETDVAVELEESEAVAE